MHHAYPLECVYPHQGATLNPLTESEWLSETGQDTQASEDEVSKHIADDTCAVSADCAEDPALPWDTAEELLVRDDTRHSQMTPSGSHWQLPTWPCIVVVAGLALVGLWMRITG